MIEFPRKVAVCVDSNEQLPLLFPKTILWHPRRGWEPVRVTLEVKKVRLKTGDYTLADWPDLGGIERKRKLPELFQNLCTDDWPRARAAFARMAEAYRHPYLMLEGSIADFWRGQTVIAGGREVHMDPALVFDRLMSVVHEFKLRFWWVGRADEPAIRRRLGETAARILLGHLAAEYFAESDLTSDKISSRFVRAASLAAGGTTDGT